MYTLRIIKKENGLETRENIFLGKKGYKVFYKYYEDHDESKGGVIRKRNLFDEVRESYLIRQNNEDLKMEGLQGFVRGEDTELHPFFEDEAVFIVGEKGQTIERVYGMIIKN